MLSNCINKQTINYFNIINKLQNTTITTNKNLLSTILFSNQILNKQLFKNYARKAPKEGTPIEKQSDRAIRREKQYNKLLTLPGRNLKQTLRVLKDNPLDVLKKVKEEPMSEFLEIKTSDIDNEEIIEQQEQQEQQEQEDKIKKIKNQIVTQMSKEETSFDNIYMIDCLSKMKFAIHAINKEKLIGLDIEAIEMGKKGEISLIQISTASNGHIYLFDIIKMGGSLLPFKYGLKEILENKKILKVVHDCRRDSEILFHRYQVQLEYIYDVQIAHALLQKKQHGNVPIRRYGFNELIDLYTTRKYSEVCVDIKFRVKEQLEKEPTVWSKRPLSKLFVDYASLDSAILIPIYYQIKPQLQSNFDRRFLKTHFNEQLTYFKDSIRQLYPRNLI